MEVLCVKHPKPLIPNMPPSPINVGSIYVVANVFTSLNRVFYILVGYPNSGFESIYFSVLSDIDEKEMQTWRLAKESVMPRTFNCRCVIQPRYPDHE